MVKIRFHFRELEEEDFTGAVVELEEDGVVKERFANFHQDQVEGEVWGNQCETFELEKMDQAVAFLLSSGCYHRLADHEVGCLFCSPREHE